MKKAVAIIMAILMITVNTGLALGESFSNGGTDPEEIANAMKVVNDAFDGMEDSFGEQLAMVKNIFTGIADSFKSVGSFVTPINGCVAFLKLVGIIKDGNTEALKSIMTQMQAMSEQIESMDEKLNDIAAQLYAMQASAELTSRSQKALTLGSSWRTFQYNYMEDGMDRLMSDYDGYVLDGMREWCRNEGDARRFNGVDNTKLILIYTHETGGYNMVYSSENTLPSDISEDTRYLVLGSDILPASITWKIDSYRDDIKKAIAQELKAKLADVTYEFDAKNFPAFEPGSTLPEEDKNAAADKAAEDAADLLIYRTTCAQINKSAKFTSDVERYFSLYCSHLLSAEEGLDAASKIMFLTHAFEYQVKDDFNALFDQMTIKTGVYGTFVLNVLGMSDFASDNDKISALSTYSNTLNNIKKLRDGSITGDPTFSYATNTKLGFGTITLSNTAEVMRRTRHTVDAYEGYTAGATAADIVYGNYETSANTSDLIGDSNALLLQYLLKGNGITPNFDYYNKTLGENKAASLSGTVVSVKGEQNMPTSDSTRLAVRNIIGSYFKGVSETSLNKLPDDDADDDDIVYRKKYTGTLMDTATGNLSTNKTLSAIAIYGENHWYWEEDEAAIMGGPKDVGSFSYECVEERTGSDSLLQVYYTYHYNQRISYNCLVSISSPLSAGGGSSALASYMKMCDEMAQEENDTNKDNDKDKDNKKDNKEKDAPEVKNPNTGLEDEGCAIYLAVGAAALTVFFMARKKETR